jgi:hypothetical protein
MLLMLGDLNSEQQVFNGAVMCNSSSKQKDRCWSVSNGWQKRKEKPPDVNHMLVVESYQLLSHFIVHGPVLWELNGSEVQTFIPNLVVFALLHIQIY